MEELDLVEVLRIVRHVLRLVLLVVDEWRARKRVRRRRNQKG